MALRKGSFVSISVSLDRNVVCCICHETKVENCIFTSCIHGVCRECLIVMFMPLSCPMCRTPVVTTIYTTPAVGPASLISRYHYSPSPKSTNRRRMIYNFNLWVAPQRVGPAVDRFVLNLYEQPNNYYLQRLGSFAYREGLALFGGRAANARFLRKAVMTCDVQSDKFRRLVGEVLKEHPDHCIHEIMAFSRTTCSLEEYDELANYSCQMNPIPPSATSISDLAIVSIRLPTPARFNFYTRSDFRPLARELNLPEVHEEGEPDPVFTPLELVRARKTFWSKVDGFKRAEQEVIVISDSDDS